MSKPSVRFLSSHVRALTHVREVLSHAVVDDRENGLIRAEREVFTDEEIFELEMKYSFEGNWVHLAHESQLPCVGDCFTTDIGRTPGVITCDKEEKLDSIVDACSHRGSMLRRRKADNRTTSTCPSTAGRSRTPVSG